MNETRLRTIEQIEAFLRGSASIKFSAVGDDTERYAHISRVLKRFDYQGRTKKERGVLRRQARAITEDSAVKALQGLVAGAKDAAAHASDVLPERMG